MSETNATKRFHVWLNVPVETASREELENAIDRIDLGVVRDGVCVVLQNDSWSIEIDEEDEEG